MRFDGRVTELPGGERIVAGGVEKFVLEGETGERMRRARAESLAAVLRVYREAAAAGERPNAGEARRRAGVAPGFDFRVLIRNAMLEPSRRPGDPPGVFLAIADKGRAAIDAVDAELEEQERLRRLRRDGRAGPDAPAP